MAKGKLTLKIIFFLILSDLLETSIHFFFKKSALSESALLIASPADALFFIKAMLSSGFLWIGLLLVVLIFIIWSTILSKIDLSVAVPIASFSYIFVPLVSIFLLHEKISPLRWLGIFFILIGVVLVSMSTKKPDSGIKEGAI